MFTKITTKYQNVSQYRGGQAVGTGHLWQLVTGYGPPTHTYLGAPTTNFEVDTSGSWEIFGYLGGLTWVGGVGGP